MRQDGYHVLDYRKIRRRVAASQQTGSARSSLGNPAEWVLAVFRQQPRVAVLGVECGSAEDLRVIYGYLVEPAFRWGCALLVAADRPLSELPDAPDPQWRYPWAKERLQHLAELAAQPCPLTVALPANRWRRWWWRLSRRVDSEARVSRLDAEQDAAVQAGDGVVQVIAPAGSGKTTVLIERVKELQRRGTAAAQILCMSFNRDAKVEIGERLKKAGVSGVVVRSFHGMGLAILKAEGRLGAGLGAVDDAELGQMIAEVTAEVTADVVADVAQLDERAAVPKPPDIATARNFISGYKLASMITPDEALRQVVGAGIEAQVAARIFDRYERALAGRDQRDFDDLVAGAVTLLQREAEVRRRWQNQFARVLVDEYQDIEPAQALLVGILAAPEDSLFCVGDEDQCIYAWRRATVQRIIELDQVYPGLERHALVRNYRCGRRITAASRKLIVHNKVRFSKPLHAGARQAGEIVIGPCADRTAGAALVAYLISDADPSEVVVLARTSGLLAEVAAACRDRPEGNPGVELATIHAAKGREWDRVILYGVDEGQTPHRQSDSEAGVEDERRLFYVAMTRAKLRLEIICTTGGESRFLREAGLR